MGQADWNDLGSSLSLASLKRGVTTEIAGPAGGNAFVYGYNSLVSNVKGAHGKYVDLVGWTPTGSLLSVPDGGGSVRGCMKRVTSPNVTGMSPMLFACAQGGPPSVNDYAYLLGLLDADPYEIVLAKGPIVGGLVEAEEDLTILARSSAQYSMGDGLWHHLRLDAIVQPNGDVLLQAYANDLVAHPIGAVPTWVEIPGFPNGAPAGGYGFVDGVTEIATGSAPLWGGYWGWAFQVDNALNRRGAFDALEALRAS